MLIVVGDGNDTNNDAAKGQLADLKKQARRQHVQTFAIVYKATLLERRATSSPTMIPATQTVTPTDGHRASSVDAIVARMDDRYYLTFPGYDKKLKTAASRGTARSTTSSIKIDKDELEPVTLGAAPAVEPAKTSGGFPWLRSLIIVLVALLLLIVIGVKVFSSKKAEPAPMPMPMPIAGRRRRRRRSRGPMKTVMIGAGGDEDGFPIVGWIVPLNGPTRTRRSRLQLGLHQDRHRRRRPTSSSTTAS